MSNCDHTELYIHEPTRYYRAPCPWCAINKADALTQTVADLRAERERHIDALKRIDEGPHHSLPNNEVASWARHIAYFALASPPAADPSHICAHGKDAIERCHQCEAAGAFFQPATGDAT